MAAKKILAPGVMADGLHVLREGHGASTVILEAGIAASSLSWSLVQRQVAQFADVISYDRAGFGWSDVSKGSDATAASAARTLESLIRILGIHQPVILVGHSF